MKHNRLDCFETEELVKECIAMLETDDSNLVVESTYCKI